jgi:hypothetical protein
MPFLRERESRMIYRIGSDSDLQFVRASIEDFVGLQHDPDYRVTVECIGDSQMSVRTFFQGEQVREFRVMIRQRYN